MRKRVIGVIGASNASYEESKAAEEVGELIAKNGFILVSGGLTGVMEAASKGASSANGIVVGIIPGSTVDDANQFVDISIVTNMGHARNVIIAHTADALIAIGGKEGTLSEIAIARKLGKPVASLNSYDVEGVKVVVSPEQAVAYCFKNMH